jgi:hypothetical protein
VTLHGAALAIHIAAGTIGLVLGPILMFARKRPGLHTRGGAIYHWTFLVLFLSSVVLAALDWSRVWWLALVGAGSYAFALLGYLAARRRRGDWLLRHVSGQGGSYIAMVTALLVVNSETFFGTHGSVLAWILPTVIGSPLIAWVNWQVWMKRRPREWFPRDRKAPASVPASR